MQCLNTWLVQCTANDNDTCNPFSAVLLGFCDLSALPVSLMTSSLMRAVLTPVRRVSGPFYALYVCCFRKLFFVLSCVVFAATPSVYIRVT